MLRTKRLLLPAALLAAPSAFPACAKRKRAPVWNPVAGRLMTRWAAEVRPDNALPEYPRPQRSATSG